MIQFFRNIRQKLLSDNKFSKYLAYAIGEIVLVVIGILIALSINNWNENRKNRNTEAEYYCRILDDFELNEKLIDKNLELTNTRIKRTKELLKELHTLPNDRGDILNKFTAALRHDVAVPNNITFDDLTSSGQLKLLTDIKLKNRLIEHSIFLDNTVHLLQENRNEVVKRYTDFEFITVLGYQDIDYMKKELDEEHMALLPNVDWTNDPTHPYFIKFKDNLVFILGMQIRQKHHFSNLRQELQEPIKLLRDKPCN